VPILTGPISMGFSRDIGLFCLKKRQNP
jgi:hypothetical protein